MPTNEKVFWTSPKWAEDIELLTSEVWVMIVAVTWEIGIVYNLILAVLIDSGQNVLHSLRVHSCALKLNNICSEW